MNLAWRPHWYAWQYRFQFTEYEYHELSPNWTALSVRESHTDRLYSSVYEAAMVNGLLMRMVSESASNGLPVFPTGQGFEFVDVHAVPIR